MADLRLAGTAEVPELRRIADEAYRHYLPRIGRPPAPMVADYAVLVEAEKVWVAFEDAVILGFIVLSVGPDQLLVENVAVRPSAQGRGIGGHLMELAETEAGRLQVAAITLYTNEVMVENLAWYAQRGYLETHRREQDGFRRVYLSKRIASVQ